MRHEVTVGTGRAMPPWRSRRSNGQRGKCKLANYNRCAKPLRAGGAPFECMIVFQTGNVWFEDTTHTGSRGGAK